MNTSAPRNKTISPALADRLYRLAEKLERDWANVGLPDDFGSRIITSVWKQLEKFGYRRPDGSRRNETEQVEFAIALLRKYWAIGARGEAKRRREQRENGGGTESVPIELVAETAASVTFDRQWAEYQERDDPFGGFSGRHVAAILQDHGWPRERAWAFVFFHLNHGDNQIVRELMSERFDVTLTLGLLRIWHLRYWDKGYAILATAAHKTELAVA